jgi:hypothetical protein
MTGRKWQVRFLALALSVVLNSMHGLMPGNKISHIYWSASNTFCIMGKYRAYSGLLDPMEHYHLDSIYSNTITVLGTNLPSA